MIWIALAFCILPVSGSIAWAAMRAWRLWKTVRATTRTATEAAGRVLASAEATEAHVTSLGAGAERLATAMERLQASLGELAVIRAAAGEAQSLLASIRGVVPRK